MSLSRAHRHITASLLIALSGSLASAQIIPTPTVFSVPQGTPASVADLVEAVSPAVVNISVVKQPVRVSTAPGSSGFSGMPFDDLLERFGFGGQQWSYSRPQAGEGSGFIIDSNGYIATNYHVVDGASEVMVTLTSGEELSASVVGTDPRTDLALIKINNGRLPPLTLQRFHKITSYT